MKNLWLFEWKAMTRQRSYFTFLILWVLVFSLLFLLQRNNGSLSSFTNVTGTIVNILLYLLPLFMMIIGSLSITNELENGQWQLLCTYPISITTYLFGKFAGILTAQAAVFTLSFGVSMALGLLIGTSFTLKWLIAIYLFSLLLMFVFLILGILLGSFAHTRWKALSLSVAVWFFLIMIWPTALISFLGLFPYPMLTPMLKMMMVLNPAEFLRFFFIVQWDSGSIFGQSYDDLVHLFKSNVGYPVLAGYLLAYFFILFTLSSLGLKRRRFL